MPATSGAFSALLAPGLRKVYIDYMKKWPEEYSQIANIQTSKRAYEEDRIFAGLGSFLIKKEGEPIQYDTGQQGNAKRYTHIASALGFRVTREAFADDLYNVIGPKMARSLAQSATDSVELQFGALWDDIFAGATYLGFDGKPLASTTHITVFGATQVNRPATDVDLGVSSLRAALENLENTADEHGFPRMKRGTRLIVGSSFQWIAKELTESALKPYTADNEKNVFADMKLSYMVYHYQSDANAWALSCPSSEQDVNFFWRERPIFENSDDFDTKDAKFTGYMRNSMGFGDWRGWYASSGST